jgi:hypothetical protein
LGRGQFALKAVDLIAVVINRVNRIVTVHAHRSFSFAVAAWTVSMCFKTILLPTPSRHHPP